MKTREEKVKAYFQGGGHLFRIKDIDTIRDGGTKAIYTTRDVYFVNKDESNFRYGYSDDVDNIITDENFIAYLEDRLISYTIHMENQAKYLREFTEKMTDEKIFHFV